MTLAERLVKAIKELAADEFALDNFECYVERHGEAWVEKYASTFEGLVWELEQFAKIKEEN